MTAGIFALIPAHNEAPRIAAVIEGAARHLPVLVIDDGSSDDTAAVAAAAGARVIRQTPNRGKGEALKAGFRAALADGAPAVVTLDADGQHDPAEIPAFLVAWERTKRSGTDSAVRGAVELVIGARDFREMPFSRRVANTLGKCVLGWATGREIRDNQSGYRLIKRRLMEAMLASEEPGFGFEVEMIVECARRGWAIEWVPIPTIYAGEGSHINPAGHVARFLALAWRIRRLRTGRRSSDLGSRCERLDTGMSTRPRDTSDASWIAQRDVVARMNPDSRIRVAIDLSDSVRELQIEGLLARNPTWSRPDAVQCLIQRLESRIQL